MAVFSPSSSSSALLAHPVCQREASSFIGTFHVSQRTLWSGWYYWGALSLIKFPSILPVSLSLSLLLIHTCVSRSLSTTRWLRFSLSLNLVPHSAVAQRASTPPAPLSSGNKGSKYILLLFFYFQVALTARSSRVSDPRMTHPLIVLSSGALSYSWWILFIKRTKIMLIIQPVNWIKSKYCVSFTRLKLTVTRIFFPPLLTPALCKEINPVLLVQHSFNNHYHFSFWPQMVLMVTSCRPAAVLLAHDETTQEAVGW